MNTSTVHCITLETTPVELRHYQEDDVVDILLDGASYVAIADMRPSERLELAKALLATLTPDVPTTTLAFEGIHQDNFEIGITDIGELYLECEEPYDEGAETFHTNFSPERSVAIAKVILARTKEHL